MVSGWHTIVVTPPAAAAWLADKGAHVDQPGGDDLAGAIDDVGTFRHAGGADAALGLADHAIGDEQITGEIQVARRIDDPGVGKQDRAAVAQHECLLQPAARAAGVSCALSPPVGPRKRRDPVGRGRINERRDTLESALSIR